MIEVKLNGSRLYESACLIFRNGDVAAKASEYELLDEANRIISDIGFSKKIKKRHSKFKVFLLCILFLLIGVICGMALGVIIRY